MFEFFTKNLKFSKFIEHNSHFFQKKDFYKKENIILVEFNNYTSNHVGFSYLTNVLREKFHGKIYAYYGHVLINYPLKRSISNKIINFIGNRFNLKFFGIYNSFGCQKYIYPEIDNSIKKLALVEYHRFIGKKKTLKELLNFSCQGILIGDLIYDTFLKRYKPLEPTIDLHSGDFKFFLLDFLKLFYFWIDYFKRNKVVSVVSSHSVYSLGILARISTKFKTEAFILSPEYLRKVKKNFLFQSNENLYLKKIFKKIPQNKKRRIINLAKKRVSERFRGKYSSDYSYVTKSPFGQIKKKNFLIKNKRIKVLIASHAFIDAPHALGNHLFPDFYVWFNYICKLSKKTDYDWYVKTHPDFGSDWSFYINHERNVVKSILKKFDNIKLLPKEVTHNQLCSEGIDAVLTVHGTVGLDYAMLKIPTINASKFNPHVNYNFNFHPKNIYQYKKIILNLKKYLKDKKISKKEILEFYAMKNIFFSKNWLFKDFEKTIYDLKSYHNLWSLDFYDYWLKNFKVSHDKELRNDIKKFVNSKNIYLLKNDGVGEF